MMVLIYFLKIYWKLPGVTIISWNNAWWDTYNIYYYLQETDTNLILLDEELQICQVSSSLTCINGWPTSSNRAHGIVCEQLWTTDLVKIRNTNSWEGKLNYCRAWEINWKGLCKIKGWPFNHFYNVSNWWKKLTSYQLHPLMQ